MALETDTDIRSLKGREQTRRELADTEDISSGVEEPVGNVSAFTLFIEVAGSVNITVEFSPDGGETWYQPRNESPLKFSEANTDLVFVDYVADAVRLTASNSTNVTAELREVA
jgi:hypothetical protein